MNINILMFFFVFFFYIGLNDRSNIKSGLDVTGTDEHTSSIIQWRVANEALFTRKRNAAIKGFE